MLFIASCSDSTKFQLILHRVLQLMMGLEVETHLEVLETYRMKNQDHSSNHT